MIMRKKTALEAFSAIPVAEVAFTAILILLLESVLFYHFMVSPRMDAASSTGSELTIRRAALAKHRADKLDDEGQRKKLESLLAEIEQKEEELPPVLHNEDIAILIGGLAQNNNITIDSINFQERQLVGLSEYLGARDDGHNNHADTGGYAYFGQAAPGGGDVPIDSADFSYNVNLAGGFEAAGSNIGGAGSTTGSAGLPAALTDGASAADQTLSLQSVQVSFRSEFHTVGEFIKQFETDIRKVRIKSLSISRVQEGDLKNVLNLEYAALSPDAETLYPGLYVPGVTDGGAGKDSLFRKYAGYVEEGADPTILLLSEDDDVDPDFYIVLKASSSNETKISYGVYPRVETELRSNVNNAARVKLTIDGDANQFNYVYELASYQKSETRKLEASGGKLRLKVLSCPRAGDDDKVQILLDVENNTELPLEVTVVNDDVLAPRFHEGIMKGTVKINEK